MRWLLLACLALGLVVQPVTGLASELQAQTHLADATIGPAVAATPTEDGAGAALHRIHHQALCCGHAAPAPEILPAVAEKGRYLPVTQANTRTWPHEHEVAPFRPPITEGSVGNNAGPLSI